MFDLYKREITYLRIAVTDRCNYRCVYCMPPEGMPLEQHDKILSYEQIELIAKNAVELGIKKIRLTGGEPLVRRNIEHLVAKLASLNDLQELCMTTNGIYLDTLAEKLKDNGLDRVNISIDSLEPDKYKKITRGGELKNAIRGVDAAIANNLTPVKINMVVFNNTKDEEIDKLRLFCEQKGVLIQLIKHFDLSKHKYNDSSANFQRPPKCEKCNRIRLTSDGFLKPCLFSEDEIAVDFSDIRGSLLSAVSSKPGSGTRCNTRLMYQIGG